MQSACLTGTPTEPSIRCGTIPTSVASPPSDLEAGDSALHIRAPRTVN